MLRPLWVLCVGALVFAPRARSIEPPPIGPEVVLDHGFRYPVAVYGSNGCDLSVADSTVLLAYGDDEGSPTVGRIVGYRRTQDGREIDVNGVSLSTGLTYVGPFCLSGFDGAGWKMAYLYDAHSLGCTSLWLRGIDPRSLQATSPDLLLTRVTGLAIQNPAAAWSGVRHVIAWVETDGHARTLRMIRVRPQMTIEDPSPITVASGVEYGSVSVAADADGGMIVWTAPGHTLMAQPLDDQGLPSGSARAIGTAETYPEPSADVHRFLSGWFVAWTHPQGIAFALLDASGALEPPGVTIIGSQRDVGPGLSVAASDSVAMVTWRDWGQPPYAIGSAWAMQIQRHGSGWLTQTTPLSADAPYEQPYYMRNIACAWTGSGFAVLWSPWFQLVTGKGGNRSGSRVGPANYPEVGSIYAQWLGPDGQTLFPEPIVASQASYPFLAGVAYADHHFVAILPDAATDLYEHTILLDTQGRPAAPPGRYRTPVSENLECDLSYCEWDYVSGGLVRGLGALPGLIYPRDTGWSGSLGEYVEDVGLVVDRVDGGGTLRGRTGVGVDNAAGRSAVQLGGYDVTANSDDATLVVFCVQPDGSPKPPPFVRAVRVNPTGHRTWTTASDSACAGAAAAALGSRYLVVWYEGKARPQLRRTVIDPSLPGNRIAGTPLVPGFGVQGTPCLIPGSGQILCAFPAKPPGAADYDIYAMRFDMDGAPIDTQPRPICRAPGDQGWVTGVWDSNQYLVSFSNLNPQHKAILGARVGDNGGVIDSVAFVIVDWRQGPASLASDEHGNVLAAYGGNRVRPIADLLPIPTDDGPGWDQTNPGERSLWVGRVIPNPGVGRVHLDLDLPLGRASTVEVLDAAGRLVRSDRYDGSGPVKGWFWDGRRADGAPAPSGAYYLRVRAGGDAAVRKAYLIR